MQKKFPSCRRCLGERIVKAGFVGVNQRYLCRDCGYHFTQNRKGVAVDIKRLAMHLFIEGLSYRAISRITGVSDVAVARWINPVKDGLLPLRRSRIKMAEIHKLEHFFYTKELFDKYGWLLIGIEENRDICLIGSYTVGNCRLTGE